jgi:hypothetical protein
MTAFIALIFGGYLQQISWIVYRATKLSTVLCNSNHVVANLETDICQEAFEFFRKT